MNNTLINLNTVDLREVNGGGLGGALAGAILGGTAGICAYTGKAIVTGEASANGFWKAYTSAAITCAGIGVWFPV